MQITVLGAAGGQAPGQSLTGFLIDDALLLDAGTIGAQLDLASQRKIKHVLITHAHLDHVNALPFLLDNLIGRVPGPVIAYGLPEVLQALTENIFNNKIWPDFLALPTPEEPILKLQPITPGQAFSINGYSITPVRVNHSFAAAAYLISNHSGTVIFTGDTGPVDELWQAVGGLKKIHALFMECSFPQGQQAMAKMTKHLSTADIADEVAKTGRGEDMPVYLYHCKPEYCEEIASQAQGLNPLQVRMVSSGEVFDFSG